MLGIFVIICIVIIAVTLYEHYWKKRVKVNDVVLYIAANRPGMTNMITCVSQTSRAGRMATIDHCGKDLTVSWDQLQVLKIDRTFPILFRGKPKAKIESPGENGSKKEEVLFEGDKVPRGYVLVTDNIAELEDFPLYWLRRDIVITGGKIRVIK